MLNVLCFNCGAMYQAAYGIKEITKQCPKCKDAKTYGSFWTRGLCSIGAIYYKDYDDLFTYP
jgi:hypothetical protein